ncbi:hypothetical protein [uncultured Cellulomonas sp.]|uniref:hypothetical protein n=1 Tax=uncultured Cellulomonas sp. TaxID=189682 RepID=UPI00262DF96F|nr:hypothetical protein [uncultured Cellulomonas sp.]
MVQAVALGVQHESFSVASPPQQPPSLVTAWAVSRVSCAVGAVVMVAVVVSWQQPIGSLLRGVIRQIRVERRQRWSASALAARPARGTAANAHHHRCLRPKGPSPADQGSMKIAGPVAGLPILGQ